MVKTKVMVDLLLIGMPPPSVVNIFLYLSRMLLLALMLQYFVEKLEMEENPTIMKQLCMRKLNEIPSHVKAAL